MGRTLKKKTRKRGLHKDRRSKSELRGAGSTYYYVVERAERARAAQARRSKLAKRKRPQAPSEAQITDRCATLIPKYDPWRDAGDQYVFVRKLAQDKIRFVHRHCVHQKGRLGGQAFKLHPVQQAIIGNIFGWVNKETGLRRYRKANIVIPEKNGKTPLAAIIGSLLYLAEAEPGSEGYCLGWKVAQAKLVYEWVRGMILDDEYLSARCDCKSQQIDRLVDGRREPNAWFKYVAAENAGAHGLQIHFAVIDELHTWEKKRDEVFHVMHSKTGARSQPLNVNISTAGWDREGVCYTEWTQSRRNRDGEPGFIDPTVLPCIFEPDPDEDWTDPAVYRRVNPLCGETFDDAVLVSRIEEAKRNPRKENFVKQLNLNIWTEQALRYFHMAAYDECPKDPVTDEDMRNAPRIFTALDTSLKNDLTALVSVWREPDGVYACRALHWIPEADAREREEADGVPYRQWAREGWLEIIPGEVINLDYIERELVRLRDNFGLGQVFVDPAWLSQWGAPAEIRMGIEVIAMPQTPVISSFSNANGGTAQTLLCAGSFQTPMPRFRPAVLSRCANRIGC